MIDRRRPAPIMVRAALLVLAGLGAALGQAPWSLWYLALPSWGLGLALVGGATGWRGAAGRGWLFGAAHFLLALAWIHEPFLIDRARDGWMAPFAPVLLAAGLALFWAGAAALAAGATARWRGSIRLRIAALALMLVAAEAARGHLLGGFPWALPGHLWLSHPPEQLATLAGAGGLTLFTLGLAVLPLLARWRGLGVALGLLAAVWGWGTWQAGQSQPADHDFILRLVQPDADQALKWHPDHAAEYFDRHLDLSAAPAPRRPDLIIWPETAVPFLLDDPGWGLEMITAAAGASPVALGIQRSAGLRAYNSLALIGRDAEGGATIRATYDKHKLVPFGEYIPGGAALADWLGIFAFSPAAGAGYSAGPGPAVVAAPGIPAFQPLICYEAVFPAFQHRVARPEWLLQVTNDAWFGRWSGPYQHLQLARLRSIESGLPLARVANTGISGLIDGRGRLRAALALDTQGFLDIALPSALPPTPYARLGRWPALLIWLLGGAGWAAGATLARRGRSVAPARKGH